MSTPLKPIAFATASVPSRLSASKACVLTVKRIYRCPFVKIYIKFSYRNAGRDQPISTFHRKSIDFNCLSLPPFVARNNGKPDLDHCADDLPALSERAERLKRLDSVYGCRRPLEAQSHQSRIGRSGSAVICRRRRQ